MQRTTLITQPRVIAAILEWVGRKDEPPQGERHSLSQKSEVGLHS